MKPEEDPATNKLSLKERREAARQKKKDDADRKRKEREEEKRFFQGVEDPGKVPYIFISLVRVCITTVSRH